MPGSSDDIAVPAVTVPDDRILSELVRLGFSDALIAKPRRLIVSSSGADATGKTAWALTAPEPIVFFDIDLGMEGVAHKAQEEGKHIYRYQVRMRRQEKKDVYEALWTNLESRLKKAWGLKRGTVIIDTASEAFEIARLAAFGRLTQVQPHNYTQVNNEWRDLLTHAYDSRMNTIFIHKVKAVWLNTTDSKGQLKSIKTKDTEVAGFGEMNYLPQVNIVHLRQDDPTADPPTTTFSVAITKCRHSPSITGMVIEGLPLEQGDERAVDPLCNFNTLLDLVHGVE